MIFENSDKMKFERKDQMCKLKKEIICYLFDEVARYPRDTWLKYKGEFKYEDKTYDLECECKRDDMMFTYKNFHIEHKRVVIDIDTPEGYDFALKRGMIQ